MKTIGKYQVLDEIGSSASGTTYRVRDVFRNRDLAVKVLGSFATLNAISKDKLYSELAACAELSHRHIAKIHDLGELDGDGIYIASELLAGTDLKKRLEAPPEPMRQKLSWIAQVCEALAVAHGKSIAHGNLKPGNIFIGAGGDASILDFGTGRWQASLLASNSKKEGFLPKYFAPEQILGQPFDARSDIFSVALMLYELLAGRYPFQVADSLLAREIVHSEPEPLRQVDSQIPEELETLVKRALARSPEDRLQTADEFAAGLYKAAQQVRRLQTAPIPDMHASETPVLAEAPAASAPSPAETPVATAFAQTTIETADAPGPAPVTPQPAPPIEVQATPEAPQTMRERTTPSASDAEPQPWTARSYIASRGAMPKINLPASAPEVPATPAEATSNAAPAPLFAPLPNPAPTVSGPALKASVPKSPRSRPSPVPGSQSNLRKRVLVIAITAVLAICVVGSFVSRQKLGASQKKTSVPVSAAPAQAVPETAGSQPAQSPAPAPITPLAQALETFKADPPPELILRTQVKPLWEAGKYAQALEVVDEVLAKNPASPEARAWKKKILAAQEAEAAMK